MRQRLRLILLLSLTAMVMGRAVAIKHEVGPRRPQCEAIRQEIGP